MEVHVCPEREGALASSLDRERIAKIPWCFPFCDPAGSQSTRPAWSSEGGLSSTCSVYRLTSPPSLSCDSLMSSSCAAETGLPKQTRVHLEIASPNSRVIAAAEESQACDALHVIPVTGERVNPHERPSFSWKRMLCSALQCWRGDMIDP